MLKTFKIPTLLAEVLATGNIILRNIKIKAKAISLIEINKDRALKATPL
jgi:hypothetical protein